MDSKQQTEVLENYLLPWAYTAYGTTREYFRFMQDNVSVHRSRHTSAWFSEMDMDVLKWPAKSLDLNPIENVWCVLARKVYPDGCSITPSMN